MHFKYLIKGAATPTYCYDTLLSCTQRMLFTIRKSLSDCNDFQTSITHIVLFSWKPIEELFSPQGSILHKKQITTSLRRKHFFTLTSKCTVIPVQHKVRLQNDWQERKNLHVKKTCMWKEDRIRTSLLYLICGWFLLIISWQPTIQLGAREL